MEARRTDAGIRVGGDARQRLHDARGYGQPGDDGTVVLTAVEAAHLLHRGDLDAVDGMGFAEFVAAEAGPAFALRFAVFADLRERGFYLDPAHRPTVPTEHADAGFVVYERGEGRSPTAIAFPVYPIGEHDERTADELAQGVLAVVDGEGEVGYIEVDRIALAGGVAPPDVSGVPGEIVGDRVYLWDRAAPLYEEWFFGRPLGGREATDDVLAVSLVEAAYLADRGAIDVTYGRIRARGRELWDEAFDRRADVYAELRAAGLVPKTGYKFGAAYRTYEAFDGIDELGHSDHLIRVFAPDDTVRPIALAQDVRLAHGVGKRMAFAITAGSAERETTWISVSRLTP